MDTQVEQGKKKILIVDDERDLRDALRTALMYEGMEVAVAENGEEGLAFARTAHPDLILLDIMMPVKDGIEMLRALREDEWGKQVPVIMLTASDDMEKLAAVTELGGSDYILKTSVSLSDVVKKVRARLG